MKNKIWTNMILKIVFILILIALLLWKSNDSQSWSIAISMVIVLALLSFLRIKYKDKYLVDERTKKLSSYAASVSWFVTLILVTLLYWNNYLGLVAISSAQMINIIFLVMIISIIAARVYYFRKGDS